MTGTAGGHAVATSAGGSAGPAWHRRRGLRGSAPEWVDRFLGSDPGLNRLRTALQTVVTIGVAMAAEGTFVHFTHALQTTIAGASGGPAVTALNHAILVIAIMLGAVVGMLASFSAAMFTVPRAQLVTFALMPVPMVAGLALGLALGPYRVAALASLAVVMAAGAYCRRFGPRGMLGGMLLFMGDFFGFFLHQEVSLADIGWLTAEIGIGVLVAIVAQFTLFYPSRRRALRRMLRSYAARARDAARRSLDLFDEPDPRARARAARRLRRRLVRLNETALMIDAQLTDAAAIPPGWSPPRLHQAVFDAELALTNIARFAEHLAELPVPPPARALVRQALACVAGRDLAAADRVARDLLTALDGVGGRPASGSGSGSGSDDVMDDDAGAENRRRRTRLVLLHRLATSVIGLAAAAEAWLHAAPAPSRRRRAPPGGTLETAETLESPVMLAGGWLPGAAMVSAEASRQAPSGEGYGDRIRLAPHVRVSIQLAVAVSGAIVFGELLSGRRFYWAVIAAFVTFMGANNAGEQLRKGFHRVLGTFIGVLLGAVGAHLVGDRADLNIAVVLVVLFVGLYLMRISYALMVVAITIMVSQLYVQLDEFSDSLLALRLEETAVGAGVAALTVLCVLPLRNGRVARVAARHYVEALAEVAREAVERLTDPDRPLGALRTASRRLDASYQTLLASMSPLRVPLPGAGDGLRDQFLHSATAARHYARNLVVDTLGGATLETRQREALRAAEARLADSLGGLAGPRQDARRRDYVRSAAMFDLVAQASPGDLTAPLQFALRDLQLIDGAMAAVAQSAGLGVRALETDPERPPARGTRIDRAP